MSDDELTRVLERIRPSLRASMERLIVAWENYREHSIAQIARLIDEQMELRTLVRLLLADHKAHNPEEHVCTVCQRAELVLASPDVPETDEDAKDRARARLRERIAQDTEEDARGV